ncbi:MAG: phenylacetate--CoA ligase family protein [bacterium]
MTEHYDDLETRDPTLRQTKLIAAVGAQVGHAIAKSPAYAQIFAGVDARAIASGADIAALPVTRKSELAQRQRESPPFGELAAYADGALRYLFASPGPIYEPATARADYWLFARSLFAAGFRACDVAHNAFSYHLTPAGAMGDSGCHALGCAVIPAGVGQAELQVATISDLKPNGYIGTPSFLRILLEKADELRADASSLRKALVSGEALPPVTRQFLAAHGIAALQAYATADLGLIAYETIADDGLVIDEGVYVEIVRPGGAQPLADGEVGEVVVTTLNPDYPLIRFATGDLSAIRVEPSACGRTNRRIKGWMGRADQTAKVRGMFVHPAQIDQVLQRHAEIARARLVIEWIEQRDSMTLKCELRPAHQQHADDPVQRRALTAAIAASIRDLCKVRGEVELLAPDSLANDGVIIEDAREYE